MLESNYIESKRRVVVRLEGDLKSTSVPEAGNWLATEWPRIRAQSPKQIQLDLREAKVVDSTGLNWVFQFLKNCRDLGVKPSIQIASPAAQRVFQFAGLDKLATVKFRSRKQL